MSWKKNINMERLQDDLFISFDFAEFLYDLFIFTVKSKRYRMR